MVGKASDPCATHQVFHDFLQSVCHGLQDYRWSMAHPALHGMMEIVPHMRAVRLCLALYGVLAFFWYSRQITTPCTVSRVADCDSGSV